MQLNNGIIILERNIFYEKEFYWISKLILLVTVRCCQSTLKRYKHKLLRRNIFSFTKFRQSINQFSGPAYPWGVAGAAAQVGASKHLDPLQQRIDALLGCQGETN